ncbi:MAG: hypothetical protein QOE97_1630, partial [Pseudonocardiales bacterium]|nr:hypothetical protein [Pseudonocardiales bacterium]
MPITSNTAVIATDHGTTIGARTSADCAAVGLCASPRTYTTSHRAAMAAPTTRTCLAERRSQAITSS